MGLMEQVQGIRGRVQSVDRERAKRQADREVAEEHHREALEALQEEFGVSTVAEAEEKHTEVLTAVQSRIGALNELLAEVEA